MFTATARKPNGSFTTARDVVLQKNQAWCPSLFGTAPLVCYCACPVPFDDTHLNWVAVFSTPMSAATKPMHADDLPFPLCVPLYPLACLLLVGFRALPEPQRGVPPPMVLHWPNVRLFARLCLTDSAWAACQSSWARAIRSLSLPSWLSYAFDGLWTLQPDADDGEEDVFVDPSAGGAPATAELQAAASFLGPASPQPRDSPASVTDSDMDDGGLSEEEAPDSVVSEGPVDSSEDDFDFTDAVSEDDSEGDDKDDAPNEE